MNIRPSAPRCALSCIQHARRDYSSTCGQETTNSSHHEAAMEDSLATCLFCGVPVSAILALQDIHAQEDDTDEHRRTGAHKFHRHVGIRVPCLPTRLGNHGPYPRRVRILEVRSAVRLEPCCRCSEPELCHRDPGHFRVMPTVCHLGLHRNSRLRADVDYAHDDCR